MTQIFNASDIKARLLQRVASTLEDYISFHEDISRDAREGWPTFSQSIRIKALLDNQRILVADDTGVNGKTFTATASKFALDKETGKKNPAVVIAPNCGMLNAWAEDEINRYAEYMNAPQQNVVTVEEYNDLRQVQKGTDFAVINWEKLSIEEDDKLGRWRLIDEALKRMNPELYILDECHNAKGSSSLRAKSMRRITEQTKGKHLMLLSATPIPNRYRDLGMIFHMLDPAKYSTPTMFSHVAPEVMKELLDRQVWFRLTRQDLKEELGLPDFKEFEIPVNLREDEAEAYFKGWADCVSLGEGLTELRKTLYDPRLSKYGAGITRGSSILEKAAELTDELTAKGEKIIIKTNYVTDVLDTVVDAVNHKRAVIAVHGAVPQSERKIAYWQFKNNPDMKVLVVSQVAEESLDLTTGDTPVSLLALEPEMTPREFTQFSGRVYRRGQRAPVKHFTFVPQSQFLNEMMIGYLGELAEEYGIKVPKKFKPRTIHADMLAMRKAKNAIVEKVYGGDRITKNEESVYDAAEIDRAVSHLEGLVSPSTFRSMKPFELSAVIQTRWRNLGEEQFDRLVHSRGWKKWRTLYEDGWKGGASEATNKLIGKIVDEEAKKGKYQPVVVSVGDGRAYFSRATGRPAIGVDLDEQWLKQGKKDCERKKIEYDFRVAPATDTTLPDKSTDVVVNAYTIFYLGQDDKRNEVEDAVIETNRIMRKGGKFVVALPYSIDDEAVSRFGENLGDYGFAQRSYLSPKQTKCNNMKNGCHILAYEKKKDVKARKGKDLSFYANRRRFAG